MYQAYGITAHPDDVYFTHLARNFAIRWACRVGSEACQKDAADMMSDHYANGSELDKNVQDIIACAGMRALSVSDYQILLGQIDGTGNAMATKDQAINTVLCSYNAAILKDILAKLIAEESIFTNSERVNILNTLVKRDIQSLELVLEFLQTNTDTIKGLISVADITTIFTSMSVASYSTKHAPTIRSLSKLYENQLGNAAIEQISNQLTENGVWMAQNAGLIISGLTDLGEPDGASTIIVSGILLISTIVLSILRL